MSHLSIWMWLSALLACGPSAISAVDTEDTAPLVSPPDTGPSPGCTGTLSGGFGVGPRVTCDVDRPCDGTAYIAVYDRNPQWEPGVAPVGLQVLAGVDLSDMSPVPFEIADVPCGPAVAVAFLDIDDNAGEPPRPSPGDPISDAHAGQMTADGVEALLVLDRRVPPR